MAPSTTTCTKLLQMDLKQIKRDIASFEAKVEEMSRKKSPKKIANKENEIQSKNARDTNNVEVIKCNCPCCNDSKRPEKGKRKEEKCCSCSRKKDNKCEKYSNDKAVKSQAVLKGEKRIKDTCKCYCTVKCNKPCCLPNVTTKICGRDHVHHTIRIPAGKPEPKEVIDKDATWSDIFQQSSRKSDRREKKTSADEKARNDALAEAVALLQQAVRDAREEKEAAKLEAARNALAADKLKVIMEANAVTLRHHAQTVEAEKKRAEELLEQERRDKAILQAAAIMERVRSAGSPEPSSTGSRRFHHSSPNSSNVSLSDASDVSWDKFSSIRKVKQDLTFKSF